MAWRHLVAWLVRRRVRVRITGHSMTPTLLDGDHVLVQPYRESPQRGDVVWLEHPQRPGLMIVKRVAGIDEDGRLDLRGDAPQHSTDSRHYGPVGAEQVRGRVVWRLPR